MSVSFDNTYFSCNTIYLLVTNDIHLFEQLIRIVYLPNATFCLKAYN